MTDTNPAVPPAVPAKILCLEGELHFLYPLPPSDAKEVIKLLRFTRCSRWKFDETERCFTLPQKIENIDIRDIADGAKAIIARVAIPMGISLIGMVHWRSARNENPSDNADGVLYVQNGMPRIETYDSAPDTSATGRSKWRDTKAREYRSEVERKYFARAC